MTLKEAVLNVLIENYPLVKTHLIHRVSEFSVSSDVRFRELRKEHGLHIVYMASKKAYRVHTKKAELKKILKTLAAEGALMESHINELYADCATREEYTETCSRINLWMLCDLDPETAMEYLRRK